MHKAPEGMKYDKNVWGEYEVVIFARDCLDQLDNT